MRAIIPENARSPRKPGYQASICAFFRAPAARGASIDRANWRPVCPTHPAIAWCTFAPSRAVRSGARWLVRLVSALGLLVAPVARAADDTVTLNFVNADIDAVVQGGRRDHRPQLRDRPEGQGHDQHHLGAARCRESLVYPTLLSALRLQGFAAVESDGVTKIVPEADAKQQGGAVTRRAGRAPAATGSSPQVITLQVRVRDAARQRAAAADHAEQHDRRLSRAATRSSSPTTPTTCSASTRSSPRSTSRPAASRSWCRSSYASALDIVAAAQPAARRPRRAARARRAGRRRSSA